MKKERWYFDFTDQEKAEFKREYPKRLHSNIFAQRMFTSHVKVRKQRKFKRLI
jgi:hypothetical protein